MKEVKSDNNNLSLVFILPTKIMNPKANYFQIEKLGSKMCRLFSVFENNKRFKNKTIFSDQKTVGQIDKGNILNQKWIFQINERNMKQSSNNNLSGWLQKQK